ncbi:E3 ubiquitin-protein ligase Topors-like [Gracilinanus agilis]|uniref:E3 ubiquitin-protein ligase Topors-like n=1 Tax=Gracilinanus agilis TaxID=191870 RepID=UPI001CFD3B52|nr:E3 ubiquitin-protein ligase Topors-like [Gracilinanus agilis]
MPLEPLPICQCPIYLNGTQDGADSIPSSHRFVSDCPHERMSKKIKHPLFGQGWQSLLRPSRSENDTKKQEMYHLGNDTPLQPEEDNSYVDSFPSCQPRSDGELSDDDSIQANPLKYQVVQELLKQFSGNKPDQAHEVSSGYFKEQVVIEFRRALYFSGLQVLYVRGGGFYRHISSDFFQRNQNCLQRLIPWLKRELTAIYGDFGYTAKNILSIILQNMTVYDLDSQPFYEILEPYLLQYTKHFLHEFISFARSPFNMKTYDQRAIYECPSPYGRGNLFTISPATDKGVLPALENYAEMFKINDDSGDKGILPRSYSNHNMTSELTFIPSEKNIKELNRARSYPLRIPTTSESGDSRGVTSSQSYTHISLLKSMCGEPIELAEPTTDGKRNTSERKIDGRKLKPEEDRCLGDNRANYSTSSISTTSHSSPKEKKLLSLCQSMKTQEKDPEKNKNTDSSGKSFQSSHPLLKETQGSQKKSQNYYSENAHFLKRSVQRGQRVHTFRKERFKGQSSSQCRELSSHHYRRLRSSQTRDHKNPLKKGLPPSNKDKPRLSRCHKKRRSRSRDDDDRNLRGNHSSEPLLTISCEAQEDDKEDDTHPPFRRIVLTSAREFISTRGKSPKFCIREKAFRVKSPNVCLPTENHRSNCQGKRRSGTVCVENSSLNHEKMGRKRRFKCQPSEKENNGTMPNSLPASVQRHQINEFTSFYRPMLPKQYVKPLALVSKHTISYQEETRKM